MTGLETTAQPKQADAFDAAGIEVLTEEGGDATVRSAPTRSKLGLAFLGASLVALLLLTYVGITFLQVVLASRQDQSRPVDAIVVLGAAQFDGVPSPVLERRLDRALQARALGHSNIIVTTGAAGPGDVFTEGFVSFEYLLERGVPESDIVVITDGRNTYESLSATSAALQAAGLGDRVLLVSDPYHALRAKEIAREVGLDAFFLPTESESSFRQLLRETAGVSLGRFIGYRRVSNLSEN